MAFVLVTEAIIVREELFIIVLEVPAKSPDLSIAAWVILPESLNSLLIHQIHALNNVFLIIDSQSKTSIYPFRVSVSAGRLNDSTAS